MMASTRGDEGSDESATKPAVVKLVGEEPISIKQTSKTHHMRIPIQISSDEDERISNQVLIHGLCSSTRIISVVKGRYCKLIKEKYHPLNHKPGTRVLTDKEQFKFSCWNK